MKTVVENATNLSKYLLNDDVAVTLNEDHIVVGDPPQFMVADLNSSTASVVENVTTAPDDWIGNKYTYVGTTWTANPDWIDPT